MRDDEKKVISVEEIEKSITGYRIDMLDIFIFVILPALCLVPIIITVLLMPKAIKDGGELAAFACGLVIFLFAVPFLKGVANGFSFIKTVRKKNEPIEIELIEAKVSSVSQWEESVYYGGHSGRKWHRYETRYDMTFQDYGTVRCGSYVREGDIFYLAINKKDNSIWRVYSPSEYRIKR